MKQFAIENYITGAEIKKFRKQFNFTQAELAALVNVSKKTIERWESRENKITGPVVCLFRVIEKYPGAVQDFLIPEKSFPLRIWYMFRERICTIIDVDERRRLIRVYNFTENFMLQAFGRKKDPDFEDYEAFLESRCFPRTRDKMKIILKEMNLPFYDPMMIIEKTQGRMAEDEFWIKIER